VESRPGFVIEAHLSHSVHIDDKAPRYELNQEDAQQQANEMRFLIPKLNVKNANNCPTQIFIKKR